MGGVSSLSPAGPVWTLSKCPRALRSQMETPTWTSRSIRNFSGLATCGHERRSPSFSVCRSGLRSQLRIAWQVGSETQP